VSRYALIAASLMACSSPEAAPTSPPRPTARDASVLAPDAAGAARAARIELTFTGDIMFGGYFDDHYDPQEVELHDTLVDIDALLVSDLTLSNLETTITRKLPNGGKAHDGKGNKRFVTIPERIAILPKHHIKTVSLANNHQYDNDTKGLVETPEILAELGIATIGAARTSPPRFRTESIDVKGWHLAFIAATTELNRSPRKDDPLIAFSDPKLLRGELEPLIVAARKNHDLVFVVVHWGLQYQDAPVKWQIDSAHAFIDAGADAVIGHHPHHLQGIERYRDGLIAYSLGNFSFPNAKEPIRQTGVLRLGFTTKAAKACLELAVFHPAVQQRSPITHPVPAKGELLALVEKRFFGLSMAKPLATQWRLDGERFVTTAVCPP